LPQDKLNTAPFGAKKDTKRGVNEMGYSAATLKRTFFPAHEEATKISRFS
jgi:hypothetical protein